MTLDVTTLHSTGSCVVRLLFSGVYLWLSVHTTKPLIRTAILRPMWRNLIVSGVRGLSRAVADGPDAMWHFHVKW